MANQQAHPEGTLVVERELDFPTSAVGPEKAWSWFRTGASRRSVFPSWWPSMAAEKPYAASRWARAWLADYDLGHVMARLRAPPLTRSDFQGFVSEQRLAKINAALAERPFRGLVVACPWVPDLLSEKERGNLDAASCRSAISSPRAGAARSLGIARTNHPPRWASTG